MVNLKRAYEVAASVPPAGFCQSHINLKGLHTLGRNPRRSFNRAENDELTYCFEHSLFSHCCISAFACRLDVYKQSSLLARSIVRSFLTSGSGVGWGGGGSENDDDELDLDLPLEPNSAEEAAAKAEADALIAAARDAAAEAAAGTWLLRGFGGVGYLPLPGRGPPIAVSQFAFDACLTQPLQEMAPDSRRAMTISRKWRGICTVSDLIAGLRFL